jgi:hypothetical protein
VDPDALLHPVGPQLPRVYWLRRLALLVLLAVIVIGLAKACSGGGGDNDRLSSEPTPTATSASPEPPNTKPARCDEESITVNGEADEETYPAGVLPQFTAEVHNISDEPCRLATQEAARTWTVRSGEDVIWDTGQCEYPRNRSLHRLGPGKAITYSVVWDRHRSVEGCASPGDEAQPGTYRFSVSVDGVGAKRVIFHLTD